MKKLRDIKVKRNTANVVMPIMMSAFVLLAWASLPALLELLSRLFFGGFIDQYQYIDSFHFWGVRAITYLTIFYVTKALVAMLSAFQHYKLKLKKQQVSEGFGNLLGKGFEIELKQDEDWEN